MIRMKIAFALRLVDDFSGKGIAGEKFLFTEGSRVVHPVEKAEGLFIFLEPQEREVRVGIESAGYHACSVTVKKELLDPEEPVADVRMYGRPGKEYSRSVEWLTGAAEGRGPYPAEVYARKSSPTGLTFREYRNIEGGHWVWFQGFTKEKLTGRTYVLGEGKDESVFVLAEKRGINEYRIEPAGQPPARIKAGEPLIRIYRSVTDRSGAYSIPVDAGEEKMIREVRILHHTSPS